MKVLFINRMMGTAWGGGENYDFNLAQGLRKLGHQVTFLTARRIGDASPVSIGGIELVSFEIPYLRQYMYRLAGKVPLLPGMIAELDLQLFRARALFEAHGLIARRGFDLVQILGVPSLAEDFRRRKLPVSMRFPGPPAWFHQRRLKRFSHQPGTLIFSHGDTVRYFHERFGIGIENVPPGVLSDLYRPMDSIARRDKRRSLGLQPDDFVIVSVSRLIQGKGHEFLLRAAAPVLARNGRARLLIVGEGNLRAGLQAQAAGLSIQDRVHFAGHQHKEGVAACLGISNLFCLFSDYENYSNAALEAMSCGLPVLASRVGGFPLQIEQGINGYLVDRGDVAGATMRIEALMASRDLCHKLSQGATRFAANFSWEATAARASGLYERIARVH